MKKKLGKYPKSKKEFDKYTYHDTREKVPYVTLWVNTFEYVVRPRDPDDEWDAGDYGEDLEGYGVCIGAQSKSSYLGRDKSLSEEHLGFFPNKGDTVFLVIESYGTGSTFGHTSPCYQPVKIFKTYDDAKAWLVSPEGERCKDSDYFGGHNEYLIKDVVVQ